MGEAALRIALIGFGEAGAAFAPALIASGARVAAFDVKTFTPTSAEAKRADYVAAGVAGLGSAAEAAVGADLLLSLVTADQALAAASDVAGALPSGALFCDMNSVAPQTKRQAAAVIEAAGGRYVDVAVLAPVQPLRAGVPLLVGGPHAADAADALRRAGFTSVSTLDAPVGAASAIKMIRSVMIKGIEALSAECLLAAAAAGVSDEVIASLDASCPGADWARRGDYNIDRMMVHGLRRAAEMEEVVKTLQDLGLSGSMARATAEWQRAIGALQLTPPEGLGAKVDAVFASKAKVA
jgi:3-hydroxyisobutyrate dehydrogenase-like beta-hydroxyacid dehydrogenase